jgi:hypothetical protein
VLTCSHRAAISVATRFWLGIALQTVLLASWILLAERTALIVLALAGQGEPES